MLNPDFSDEQYISRVGRRPNFILNRVISIDESIKLSFPEIHCDPPSSLGLLDTLPVELLCETFDYLDVQSLSRLSRVSFRGKAIVESRPAYKELLSTVGHVFWVLTKSRATNLHSAATLQAVLHSDRCVSCGQYGSFLFLLTAERCCLACMWSNSSFCTVSASVAQAVFDFTPPQLESLPIIHRVYKNHSAPKKRGKHKISRLTTLDAARELAQQIHGDKWDQRMNSFRGQWSMYVRKFEQSQNPIDIAGGSRRWPSFGRIDIKFPRHGAIPFPSVIEGRVEMGLWCLGCGIKCERLSRVYRLAMPNTRPVFFHLMDMRKIEEHARSRAEFLGHVKQCEWVPELMALAGP